MNQCWPNFIRQHCIRITDALFELSIQVPIKHGVKSLVNLSPLKETHSKLNQIEGVLLPQGYAVLVHGFLVIIDRHQEIAQHSVQDTVTLIGQGVAEESDPFFIFLFSAFNKGGKHKSQI